MSLKSRLTRLEGPALERWHRDWEVLLANIAAHAPIGLHDRLEHALTRVPYVEMAVHAPGTTATEVAGEIDHALAGANGHGLDVLSFVVWINTAPLGDHNNPDLRWTPHSLPKPPAEPPGVFERLQGLLGEDSDRGAAAAMMLFVLCAARGVRASQDTHSNAGVPC